MTARELAGKVALVTAAGSRGEGTGIGSAIALTLLNAGADVGLVNRDHSDLDRTLQDAATRPGRSVGILADVSNGDHCRRAVSEVVEEFGRLDILVNVVGIEGALGDATEVDLDDWNEGLRVNTTSMMLMAKHASPRVAASGGG